MHLTPEQQESLLSIVREFVDLGDSIYIYNDNNGSCECLCCNDFYTFGTGEKRHAHEADCTYLKACNLLKSIEEDTPFGLPASPEEEQKVNDVLNNLAHTQSD